MMKHFYEIILLLYILLPLNSIAYEVDTHARITRSAFDQSTIAEEFTTNSLGLQVEQYLGGSESEHKNYYYELTQKDIFKREVLQGTRGKMPDFEEADYKYFNLQGWLIRGAIREDDVLKYEDPNDGVIDTVRVVNHFYDPLNNEPLTFWYFHDKKGKTAPAWALGVDNPFIDSPEETTGRVNHFTILDAREAMFRALTGRTVDKQTKKVNKLVGLEGGGQDIYGDPIEGTPRLANEQDRLAYWATTFRALGDVAHLVQDMSQPQHTRLDS